MITASVASHVSTGRQHAFASAAWLNRLNSTALITISDRIFTIPAMFTAHISQSLPSYIIRPQVTKNCDSSLVRCLFAGTMAGYCEVIMAGQQLTYS